MLIGYVPIGRASCESTVRGMPYPSDLTDDQWELLEPVLNAPGKRGRRHADDLRSVVDAMLYTADAGCRWRYLPESFGPDAGLVAVPPVFTQQPVGAGVDGAVRRRATTGRKGPTRRPRVVVIDTHLARGASHGGFTFHDRRGPYGRRLAKSFENTTTSATGWLQVACMHRHHAAHLSRERADRRPVLLAA
jgi:transposase